MTTLYWFGVVALSRLRCHVLRRHRDIVRTGHGYVVTWCGRCYRHKLQVAP